MQMPTKFNQLHHITTCMQMVNPPSYFSLEIQVDKGRDYFKAFTAHFLSMNPSRKGMLDEKEIQKTYEAVSCIVFCPRLSICLQTSGEQQYKVCSHFKQCNRAPTEG